MEDERVQGLVDWWKSKETQQLSYPLDRNTQKILEEIIQPLIDSSLTNYVQSSDVLLDFGDGSDGALSVTSGTTSIDIGSVPLLVKNYTSISITGTGDVNFTNPVGAGSIIVLKSQGNVTITSSSGNAIDLRGMGATGGGAASSDAVGVAGTAANTTIFKVPGGSGGSYGSPGTGGAGNAAFFTGSSLGAPFKIPFLACGSGGASGAARGAGGEGAGGGGGGGSPFTSGNTASNSSGSSAGTGTSGAGGRGAGALLIMCGGALNITGTILASGSNAGATSGTASLGGGGGGGGGTIMILYNTLTADSGTYTVSGGSKSNGANAGGNGGDGGAGAYLVAKFKG